MTSGVRAAYGPVPWDCGSRVRPEGGPLGPSSPFGGRNFPVLSSEVKQDCVRVGRRYVAVDDRWQFGIRIDGHEFRLVLRYPLPECHDGKRLIWDSSFFRKS